MIIISDMCASVCVQTNPNAARHMLYLVGHEFVLYGVCKSWDCSSAQQRRMQMSLNARGMPLHRGGTASCFLIYPTTGPPSVSSLSWQTRLQSGPAVDKAAAELTDTKGQCRPALFSQFCYNMVGCLTTYQGQQGSETGRSTGLHQVKLKM